MPEGPEIRRAADKIEAVLKDKRVEKIEFGLQPLQKFGKPLKDSHVLSLRYKDGWCTAMWNDTKPLDRVKVLNERAETVGRDPDHRESHHLVIARAVGSLDVLAEYTVPLARTDGLVLAIKGAKAEEEIETAKQALYKLHASVVEVHPTSTGRIVVIEKNRAVPKAYPREVGEPKRRPLA